MGRGGVVDIGSAQEGTEGDHRTDERRREDEGDEVLAPCRLIACPGVPVAASLRVGGLAQVMMTGVPSGASSAIWTMMSLVTRIQPFEASWPMSCGSFVPWIATWPGPPLNSNSTSL